MSDRPDSRHRVTGEGHVPMLAPRFTEIATFMRAPLAGSLEEVDIALVGVPFDGGVTNRTGARHGPREIRNQSSLCRSIHHVTRVKPFELCRLADVGDVQFTDLFDLAVAIDDIEGFYLHLNEAGVRPLSAGGDQIRLIASITKRVRAFARRFPSNGDMLSTSSSFMRVSATTTIVNRSGPSLVRSGIER